MSNQEWMVIGNGNDKLKDGSDELKNGQLSELHRKIEDNLNQLEKIGENTQENMNKLETIDNLLFESQNKLGNIENQFTENQMKINLIEKNTEETKSNTSQALQLTQNQFNDFKDQIRVQGLNINELSTSVSALLKSISTLNENIEAMKKDNMHTMEILKYLDVGQAKVENSLQILKINQDAIVKALTKEGKEVAKPQTTKAKQYNLPTALFPLQYNNAYDSLRNRNWTIRNKWASKFIPEPDQN